MCINDWRLGRLIRSTVIGNSLNGQFTIPPNPSRVGLWVGGVFASFTDPTTGGAMDFIEIDRQLSPIIQLNLANSSVMFTVVDHGDLPTVELRVSASAVVGVSYTVIEFTLPESILRESIESLQSRSR